MTVSPDTEVRVRYAPSPTGHWHLGGARTTLFNWLFARKHGGKFILRIEDTDPERSKQNFEIEIIESMRWLGLDWDEGVDGQLVNHTWQDSERGPYGPYRQSERIGIYKKYLNRLLEERKAYFCYCTKDELEAARQAMTAEGIMPKYSGHCRNVVQPPSGREPQSIRFRTPEATVKFRDIVRGVVSFDAGLFGDMVIARNLESPLYNFAVVVDDEEMKITHVVRGEDLLSSTPRQILLQRALGFRKPSYAHLPLILSPGREKLSKRYAETSLLAYREAGYLPEAIVNFLGLLGWHPEDNQELFTLQELASKFDMKRVQKAGAVFDQEKLNWFNQQYLRKLRIDETASRLQPFLKARRIKASMAFLKKVVDAERDRMTTLADFVEKGSFFFKLPDYQAQLLVWDKDHLSKTKSILEEIHAQLESLSAADFEREKLMKKLSKLIEEQGRGSVLWPLRAALSGLAASPDPLVIAEVLGKEETQSRLTVALNKIGLAI